MIATLGFALLAGVLTMLSPCVLPILPLVLAAAASENRFGPAALAAGLALSFVALGLFIATVGFSIGLDDGVFRPIAAVVLIAVGLVLLIPEAQTRLALASGPAVERAGLRLDAMSKAGLAGQFAVGLLLGVVWTPCVGPTLGAASLLAAKGENLGAVGLTMAVFGVGAALPLLAIGLMSRQALIRWRSRLLGTGRGLKAALGAMLVAVGALTLTGYDKAIETVLVDLSPAWLNALTTRF